MDLTHLYHMKPLLEKGEDEFNERIYFKDLMEKKVILFNYLKLSKNNYMSSTLQPSQQR